MFVPITDIFIHEFPVASFACVCVLSVWLGVPYRAVLLNVPLILAVSSLAFFCGAAVFAYYHITGCDILRTPYLDNQNQVITICLNFLTCIVTVSAM